MNRRLLAFTTAAAVTYTAAPLVRRAMIKLGTLDVPNHRSSHTTPIPRAGGIAALAGVASALVAARGGLAPVATGSILGLTAIGYLDDHNSASGGIPAVARLAVQVTAGTAMAHRTPIGTVFAALATPAVVNVVNFMDGINGMTALTAAVWGTSAQFNRSIEIQLVGALTAGAALGFLPWNAPTAKLFLGDSGSYLFGGLISAGILRALGQERPLLTTAQVGAPLMPYVADAAQAIIRRKVAGAPLTEAHRQHVYQRVVDSGRLDHLEMAALHASLAAICATVWLWLTPAKASAVSALVCTGYMVLPTFGDGVTAS